MGGWRRRLTRSAAAAALLLGAALAPVGLASGRTTWTAGLDVSWPQCSGSSAHGLPSSSPSYVVLGLTDGSGDTVNPCLASQLRWAKAHGVAVGGYLVPSWPTTAEWAASTRGRLGTCASSDSTCRLRNVGAEQAASALATVNRVGMHVPMVWLDVEFRRTLDWAKATSENRALISGDVAELEAAGMPYGVYSTSYMWSHIVGSWTLKVANWVPSGTGSVARTKAKCSASATGGTTWLVQYTSGLDHDLTCPVMDAVAGKPGPLWRYRLTTLAMGDTGAAVRAAQGALAGAVTGVFDAPTLATVLAYQVQHGLTPTGKVDAATWRALGAFTLHGGHGFLLSRVAARQ